MKIHTIKGSNVEVYYAPETKEIFTSREADFEEFNMESNNNESHDSDCKINGDCMNLYQITLCVSNDCNLRCKYCYAQGGNYGMQRQLMTFETAERFIDFCVCHFKSIKYILFFGGEPFLNYKIIEYVCESFQQKSLINAFPLPKFAVVTNGTILNDRILNVIKKYISLVTISIDGNKQINDLNRIYSNGKGTYDDISKFIKNVKQTSCEIKYEATFTEQHKHYGIDKYKIKESIESNFHIKGTIVDEIQLQGNINTINEFEKISKDDMIKTNFKCLPLEFWQVLEMIVSKSSATFCPIYTQRFTVTTDGDIVPCQMVIGKKNSVFSSIYDTDIAEKMRGYITNYKDNTRCRNCWCNKLCGGCTVSRFYSFAKEEFQPIPNYDNCQYVKKCIETMILLVCKIRQDSTLWSLLIENVKKCQQP